MKLIYGSLLAGVALSEVYFKDNFDDGEAWSDRWIQSKHKDDYGAFDLSAGKIFADEGNTGLRTSQDAKFYARSAKFTPFSNAGKDIVVQFSVKHDQKIDCGGGYVKVFGGEFEPADMHGESEYNLMFGPDICGYSTKKVHVIFSHDGKNHLIKKEIKCKDDVFTHVYTLSLKQDNTYEVFIDGESERAGSLEEDWDMLKPKEIKDPDAKKPDDWVNEKEINDPEDSKPDGWDEEPEYIADPDATVPEDWDEEMDGEWEAPMVNNPEFKGEWKAKQIDNPDYKGPWVHPVIANPEYVADGALYSYDSWGAIGLDLWQVKSGSVFDNFLISDDIDGAIEAAKAIAEATKSGEEEMKKEQDKVDEEASKAAEDEEDDEDGEDEDDFDDVDDEEFEDDDEDDFEDHDEL
jgi:calreticulin